MQWSQWLQGGPFLEVSFLLELKKSKKETIQEIILNLSKVRNRIEIYDNNIEEIIDFFDRGYPFDDEDTQSIYMHSLRLRLYVYLTRKRKATLQIEMVSSNTIMVNFWFYGSYFDSKEWDQIGIENEEITEFTNFLKELYFVYEFKIGGMAIEEDVISLFGFDEACPNECYRYENISPNRFLQDTYGFIDIIWNEKYNKLSQVPYNHKRLDKEGILINIGSFQR
ncbi:hypothetical protein [Gottfriedia luciferensis]|uniref:hypothetical protein n=1 Tax=Gottfriedia luciferensis TaxID=178774 RepID=UPI000B442272|nr:hypothetical protein [Gottfriedia luciferensis]